MAEAWEQWHGEIVDGEYRLRQYLGGSDHSAVFLAERGREPQPVVVKFIPAHPATADTQMARWESGKKLSHPQLIRILASGRCKLGNSSFLYVVTERAEENLSQILPQRALTPRETSDMLRPVLDALSYLHKSGFAHGHIAPSNIMAVGDQIKLSSDTVSATGQVADPALTSPGDDLPEGEKAGVSKPADVWSLGATLVEVLTQRRTAWEETAHGEPLFREKLPEPFREIAKRCLHRDPARRPNVEEIRNLLDPAPSDVKKPALRTADGSGSRRGILIAAIAVLALLAIVGWTKLSSRSPQVQQSAQAPQTEPPHARPEPQPETAPEPPARSRKPAVSPPPAKKAAREAPVPSARGVVTHEVLPNVPQSARNTITGKVRVVVKVAVDNAGNVTDVTLDNPGPSKYFARLATQAAHDWKFTPPIVEGGGVPSEWLLHFAFGRSEITVSPTQVKP
jgi:TonB family protein